MAAQFAGSIIRRLRINNSWQDKPPCGIASLHEPGGSESHMKPTDSFATRWVEFERDVILPDSPTSAERENLRRVFYAGAFAFLCVSRECAQRKTAKR
jgi:hypothetical protein